MHFEQRLYLLEQDKSQIFKKSRPSNLDEFPVQDSGNEKPQILEMDLVGKPQILDAEEVQKSGNLSPEFWKSSQGVELKNLLVLAVINQILSNDICLIKLLLFKREMGGGNHLIVLAKDSNIAETPYCIPLIAETLGKVNQQVNFTVDLRPDLPAGTYTIVSDIEIDPNEIWIKHSQEKLGKIKVLEDNNKAIVLLTLQEIPEEITTVTEPKQSEVKSTGLKIIEPIKEKMGEIKSILVGSQIVSIVAIICSLLAVIVICFTIYKIKIKGKRNDL